MEIVSSYVRMYNMSSRRPNTGQMNDEYRYCGLIPRLGHRLQVTQPDGDTYAALQFLIIAINSLVGKIWLLRN